ncbi:MAG: glycosyl hydrolase family 28-related protein [bacterium]
MPLLGSRSSAILVIFLLITGFEALLVYPARYEHAVKAAPIANINTPEQPRQNPNRPRLNVKEYGAQGNGVRDDTGAIQTAIDSAPASGAIIYFPAGTYISNNFQVTNKNGLTFEGDGFSSVIKRPVLRGNAPIGTIVNSADLVIRNIAFDENGITHFGGVNFRAVRRVRIENTRHFDSLPWSSDADADHYAWHFGINEITQGLWNEDIAIVNNQIEDLTLEMNFIRRVLVEGNTIRRPYFGFGTFSSGFNAGGNQPAGTTEDLVVRTNFIVDPYGFGIALHLDPGSDNNATFRRILIANNRIRMSRQVRHGISVGATNAARGPGRVFEDIETRDNIIEVSPSATKDWDIAFLSFSSYDFHFRRVSVLNNRVTSNGHGHGGGMRRAEGCIFSGNVLQGLSGMGVEFSDSIRGNRIEGNTVETTGLAYWFGNSLGGNRFVRNRYLGRPATVLQTEDVHRSDVIEQPTQIRSRSSN